MYVQEKSACALFKSLIYTDKASERHRQSRKRWGMPSLLITAALRSVGFTKAGRLNVCALSVSSSVVSGLGSRAYLGATSSASGRGCCFNSTSDGSEIGFSRSTTSFAFVFSLFLLLSQPRRMRGSSSEASYCFRVSDVLGSAKSFSPTPSLDLSKKFRPRNWLSSLLDTPAHS